MSNKGEVPRIALVCTGSNNADQAKSIAFEFIKKSREMGYIQGDELKTCPYNETHEFVMKDHERRRESM